MSAPWSGPKGAGVQLQHQPVLHAHGGHLDDHETTEELGVGRAVGAGEDAGKEVRGLARRQIRRGRRRVAVVGRRRAGGDEGVTAGPDGFEVPLPGGRVGVGLLAQGLDVGSEAGPVRVDDVVGAESRDDPPRPTRPAQRGVRLERVQRAVRRRQELNSHPIEQRARTERVLGEPRAQAVVDSIGGGRPEGLVYAEHLAEGLVEPELRRRAAEQVVVLGERAPNPGTVGLGRLAVEGPHAESLQRHALAVEHAHQVVVPGDQLDGRIGHRGIGGQAAGVAVAVRADDG
jgi:hypothetical protein